MGGKKRKVSNSSNMWLRKRARSAIETPVDVIAALCLANPGLAEDFLEKQISVNDRLALCAVDATILKFCSDRGMLTGVNDKTLNELGSTQLVFECYKYRGELSLREMAQLACGNGHHVILKCLLNDFGVDASIKKYNYFYNAKNSDECLLLLVRWRGKDGRRAHMVQETIDAYFDRYHDNVKLTAEMMALTDVWREKMESETWACEAHQAENLDMLDLLLANGIQPRASCVNWAAKTDNSMVLAWCLNNNVDCDHNMNLRDAVRRWNLDVITLILKDGRADPNSAYDTAVDRFDKQVAAVLIQDDRFDPFRTSGLFASVCRDCPADMVATLLKDPRAKPSADDNRALSWALRANNIKTAELIIAHPRFTRDGLERILVKNSGQTAHEPVRFLMTNFPDTPTTEAFYEACKLNKYENAKYLLGFPQTSPWVHGGAEFSYACKHGMREVVEKLLQDPNLIWCDEYPGYPALCAIDHYQYDIVRLLLAHPTFDPTLQNNSLLRIAIAHDERELAAKIWRHPKVQAYFLNK